MLPNERGKNRYKNSVLYHEFIDYFAACLGRNLYEEIASAKGNYRYFGPDDFVHSYCYDPSTWREVGRSFQTHFKLPQGSIESWEKFITLGKIKRVSPHLTLFQLWFFVCREMKKSKCRNTRPKLFQKSLEQLEDDVKRTIANFTAFRFDEDWKDLPMSFKLDLNQRNRQSLFEDLKKLGRTFGLDLAENSFFELWTNRGAVVVTDIVSLLKDSPRLPSH